MMNEIPLKEVDQYQFLEHRREQEQKHWNNRNSKSVLDSILTIEVNTTELCNRTCVFCPRHDPEVFPNRHLHMTPRGARIICENLSGHDYTFTGKISFSGFGENTMNKQFPEIVHTFRKWLPNATLECNTNGDRLNLDYANLLFDSGLDLLYINLYDGPEQMDHFNKMLNTIPDEKYKFRMHWSQADHGLILNNRSGVIDWVGIEDTDVKSLQGKPCHYPFYKMFVDWNGDVLFCSNDWGREHVVGNLMQDSLFNVWMSKPMKDIRKKLIKGDRSGSPCNKCSVDGTLFGKPSFDIIKEYYDGTTEERRLSR